MWTGAFSVHSFDFQKLFNIQFWVYSLNALQASSPGIPHWVFVSDSFISYIDTSTLICYGLQNRPSKLHSLPDSITKILRFFELAILNHIQIIALGVCKWILWQPFSALVQEERKDPRKIKPQTTITQPACARGMPERFGDPSNVQRWFVLMDIHPMV